MKVALQVHPERVTDKLLNDEVYPVLADLGVAYQLLPRNHSEAVLLDADVKLILALGGDGTFLVGANTAVKHHLPILGVMVGRLGFLCSVRLIELADALRAFFNGQMPVEERTVIHGEIAGPDGVRISESAINDIVVHRVKTSGVRDFLAHFDGELIARYRADGIILASPLGSTAYNMAAGGPLVYPKLDLLMLTPICAHSMFSKPLVLPPHQRVRISAMPESYPLVISFDGERRFTMEEGEELLVRSEVGGLRFCRPASYDFFKVLRGRFQHGFVYGYRESGEFDSEGDDA